MGTASDIEVVKRWAPGKPLRLQGHTDDQLAGRIISVPPSLSWLSAVFEHTFKHSYNF